MSQEPQGFIDTSQSSQSQKMGYADVSETQDFDYSQYAKRPQDDKSGLFTLTFKWLRSKPFRFWANCSFALTAATVVYVGYNVINADPKPLTIGSEYETDMVLSTVNPATLGGITPDTPPQEKIARLQDGTERYEAILNSRVNQLFGDMYTVEANRLYQAAVKEESGKYSHENKLGIIDLKNCPRDIGQIRICVLFRYASEGAYEYRQGMEKGDINLATKGVNRYISALLAINPPAMQQPNYTRAIEGSNTMLTAYYQLTKAIPPDNRTYSIFGKDAERAQSPSAKQMKSTQQNKKQNKPVN